MNLDLWGEDDLNLDLEVSSVLSIHKVWLRLLMVIKNAVTRVIRDN